MLPWRHREWSRDARISLMGVASPNPWRICGTLTQISSLLCKESSPEMSPVRNTGRIQVLE